MVDAEQPGLGIASLVRIGADELVDIGRRHALSEGIHVKIERILRLRRVIHSVRHGGNIEEAGLSDHLRVGGRHGEQLAEFRGDAPCRLLALLAVGVAVCEIRKSRQLRRNVQARVVIDGGIVQQSGTADRMIEVPLISERGDRPVPVVVAHRIVVDFVRAFHGDDGSGNQALHGVDLVEADAQGQGGRGDEIEFIAGFRHGIEGSDVVQIRDPAIGVGRRVAQLVDAEIVEVLDDAFVVGIGPVGVIQMGSDAERAKKILGFHCLGSARTWTAAAD